MELLFEAEVNEKGNWRSENSSVCMIIRNPRLDHIGLKASKDDRQEETSVTITVRKCTFLY